MSAAVVTLLFPVPTIVFGCPRHDGTTFVALLAGGPAATPDLDPEQRAIALALLRLAIDRLEGVVVV